MFDPFLGNEKVRICGLGFIIVIMNTCINVCMDVCMYVMVWVLYYIALHCSVLYCMYISIV